MPVRILHSIGPSPTNQAHVRANYNTKEEVENNQDQLTFDGVYTNVYENRDLIKNRPSILFVVGDTIGGDNKFDTGMPLETYCTQEQLDELVADGHTLGWHTWSHPDLTTLTKEEAIKEMTPPVPMTDFAYPYGRFNGMLMEVAKELGYERAWSVTQGDDNPYSLRREYIWI